MNDNILGWFYVSIGEEHKVNGWILKSRGTPHLILDGQCAKIGEYDDD